MNFKFRLLALLLVVMICLSSCSFSIDSILQMIPGIGGGEVQDTTTTTTTTAPTTTTTTKKPEETIDFNRADSSTSKEELLTRYTLTDEEMAAAMATLDTMLDKAINGETSEEVDAIYEEFEKAFYHIAQQMTIARIIYYCDMSDEVAADRQLNTMNAFLDLQDKYNETLREMLKNSPFADVLFADWSEEEKESLLNYNSDGVKLTKEIEELQVEVDNLNEKDPDYNDKSTALYVQIVTKNNQLAKVYGYENYYDYATENVYGRDYDREELATFRQLVIDYVVPNYLRAYSQFNAYRDLSESLSKSFMNFVTGDFDSMKRNYVIQYLYSLEGSMGESMRHVFENKNCVFSDMGTSHPTAFQTYLYEDETPFCLFGSNGQTSTTIVHEIGHYYAALKNNDLESYDLLETHSQTNEFLFLNYAKDYLNSKVYSCVRGYQLVNAGYVMILATIIDEFEQAVYSLESVEGMTSADFDAIMTEICEKYGGAEWISSKLADPYAYWRNVAISNPVYYISYAVSAAVSVEIFGMTENDDVAGAYAAYTTLVEGVTEEDGFVGAVKKAGLYTPFEQEAFEIIKAVFTK